MLQLVLDVQEDRLSVLLEMLKELDYVRIVKPARLATAPKPVWTPEQQVMYDDLKEAFEQMELHRQGKIKLKTADELYQELWPA